MEPTALSCIRCGRSYPLESFDRACDACGDEGVAANLSVVYDESNPPDRDALTEAPRTLWRFADALPLDAEQAVSLGEGMSPLIPVRSPHCEALLVKDETRNPTWSFKDRLASVAVSWAASIGAGVIATSSSGNAGAAAASYAARAGLPCVVLTFKGAAGPMVEQIRAAGAMALECTEKEDRWRILSAAVGRFGWFPTSPYFGPTAGSNPIGIEGYKTLAYEVAEQLDWRVPDWCVLPVCYGDALFGLWKGFDEMRRWGWTGRMPRLVAAEVSGSLSAGLSASEPMPPAVERNAGSVAGSIDIPRSTAQALLALRRTDGIAVTLDDSAILGAQAALARESGLFVEASSAAALAAIGRLGTDGTIRPSDTVVAIATASGLKDAGTAPSTEIPQVGADLDDLRRALGENYGFDV